MIDASSVTLACVDTLNPRLALRALDRSRSGIRFARTVLLTTSVPAEIPSGVEVATIAPIASREAYSQFVLKSLVEHVSTAHVLLVQWDGYVVNPAAFDRAFLDVDYLGARWFWHEDGHDVGNGGFSMRSRRLLEALQDPRIELIDAEDTTICRTFRPLLERDHGIRFADARLADRFAFEASYPVGKPFGFHGLYNFCRVMPPPELASLTGDFNDVILQSPQLAQLLRNCVGLGHWQPAIAIAKRMISVGVATDEVRMLLSLSEDALARGTGIARNDPCPCGSGKRYKQCHGAATTATAPLSSDALVARAMSAHQRGDLQTAANDYHSALASSPQHPYAIHYLGVIAYQQKRPQEALPWLERAVSLQPHEPEFHNNLGLALAALDRNSEAARAHRAALAHKPDHAGAWNNLGLALHAAMDLEGAIDAFRRALALQPGFTQARWNLSLALLADGQFDAGWEAYDTRLAIPGFARADFPKTPPWQGDDPQGRTILLVAEQGLGDAIQFARLATLLARRGARVVLQCPAPLASLLSRVDGVSSVVTSEAPAPPHDAWLPLLSLARVLRIDAATIPADVPYLRVDPALAREVTAALAPYAATKRIGIAWTGNRANSNDARRSIPLQAFSPLLDLPGITWLSLQKDDDADPSNRPQDLDRLVRLPWRNDFEGLAAVVTSLDLVVSADTSVAHVAGALARPVHILLPFMSDWRWRRARDDSDWYPTATLVRQPAPGDWSSVVESLRNTLAPLARGTTF
jgi:tetratricopeptide (TPR) repeat protein